LTETYEDEVKKIGSVLASVILEPKIIIV